jgi:hypothetical protein
LYGYDPPPKEGKKIKNICIDFCCGPRKPRSKTKLGKTSDKKKELPRTDSTIPIFALEDIEEGLEGKTYLLLQVRSLCFVLFCTHQFHAHFDVVGVVFLQIHVELFCTHPYEKTNSHTSHVELSFSGIEDDKVSMMSLKNFEKKFGQSPVFVASTLLENGGVPQSASPAALLKEAIHVISCGYEDKSDWGKEVCIRIITLQKTPISTAKCKMKPNPKYLGFKKDQGFLTHFAISSTNLNKQKQ